MSTKTTFKRIALVAVASLGFGMLSVAPSSANTTTNTADTAELTTLVIATPGSGRVNSILTSEVTFALTNVVEADEIITLRARFDVRPAASTAVVGFNTVGLDVGNDSVTDAATVYAAGASGNELLPAATLITSDNDATTADAANVGGRVGFIPDVVGTYTVTVWHDANSNGLVDTGEAKDTEDFVVGNGPASVKVTGLSGTGIVGSDALVKLELLDAAGARAGLAANESITLTSSSADTDFTFINDDATNASAANTQTLVAADFIKGASYVNFNDDTVAGVTATITMAGVGGSVTSLSGTFTQKFVPSATPTGGVTVLTTGSTTAAAYGVTSTIAVAGNIGATTFPIGTKTLTYLVSVTTGIAAAATDQYVAATVEDRGGYVTGAIADGLTANLDYVSAVTLTAASATATTYTGTYSIKTTSPTIAENQFAVTFNDDDADNNTGGTDTTGADTAAAAATALININGLASAVSVTPSSALSLKIGSSISYTATVKDQFGRVLPNASVAMSGGTRNAVTIQPTAITDATGKATFTVTDAPAAGVTSLTDTFSFTASYIGVASNATAAGAITWSATGPVVGTVTLTTGTEDDTATSITYRDINAGATGAQAGSATVTATVKDASGNLLAGVPVTFSTASAGAAVTSTEVVKYTSAAGTVTATVYGWTAGTKTFTATAGTATGSGTVNYKQQTPTDVRKIAAKAEGSIVTVTATDRFGNTVADVKIYGTKTGTGYFGNGSSTSSATTDKNGAAEFVVQGTGSFKFAAGDATAADELYGDTDAVAGKVGATAVTASTVGTSVTAETGVGASFADAGVNSVTLDIVLPTNAEISADANKALLDVIKALEAKIAADKIATDAALAANAAKAAADTAAAQAAAVAASKAAQDAAVAASKAAQDAAVEASTAAADAAAEATDAANAATDAANASAEAGDAATAAAQDAADAVAALSTQVSEMIDTLKKQITALTNLVIKIQKKVKA